MSPDTPVTIEIRDEVMLKSALNLILEPLHLGYVVKHEVLKVTSEQMRAGPGLHGHLQRGRPGDADSEFHWPVRNMGLAGAYTDAMGIVSGGNGRFGGVTSTPLAVVASNDGKQNGRRINPAVLAQMAGGRGHGAAGWAAACPSGFGPGGAGGGAQADFDSLIDLITSTMQPDHLGTGRRNGLHRPASKPTSASSSARRRKSTRKSSICSNSCGACRTCKSPSRSASSRSTTTSSSASAWTSTSTSCRTRRTRRPPASARTTTNASGTPREHVRQHRHTGTSVAGLQNTGTTPASSAACSPPTWTSPSPKAATPWRCRSSAVSTPRPAPRWASPSSATSRRSSSSTPPRATSRSNVLQAPKVTLFNGQQAFVSDTSQTPFVISVIPVVGDFAAAQQPVIVVLSEGTFMTVQAVVSNDRRFVRLTIVPFFSKIGNGDRRSPSKVETTNHATRRKAACIAGQPKPVQQQRTTTRARRSGTTVQLPTFSFVTVTTTVSVPDGGTVLLGGIKRLSEGRNEFGVPILDKIPYLDRLFKNVGIGRETSSLMMMVTPRIIIQEEEEEKLGIAPPN